MSEATFDRFELDRLLAKLLDDVFTDEEQSRFQIILRDDPAARRHYFQYLDLHAELVGRLDRTGISPQSQPRAASPVLGFLGYASSMLSKPVLWSILAVGTVFASYVVLITWGIRERESPNGADGVDVFVATITNSSDAQWSADPSSPLAPRGRRAGVEGASVAPGEALQIDSGLVELKLKQGATLLVEGPASWSIDGDNRATLKQGKLVAKVPHKAIGFTLVTPMAEIVDLGTEFGVLVDRTGNTQMHVFRGLVTAQPRGRARNALASNSAMKFKTGQGMEIAGLGTISVAQVSMEDKFASLARRAPMPLAELGEPSEIAIANPSFEANDATDLSTNLAPPWNMNDFNTVFDPQDAQFFGTTGDNIQGELPDGGQVLNLQTDRAAEQDLGVAVIPGALYELTYWHGQRRDHSSGGSYQVRFLADGQLLFRSGEIAVSQPGFVAAPRMPFRAPRHASGRLSLQIEGIRGQVFLDNLGLTVRAPKSVGATTSKGANGL